MGNMHSSPTNQITQFLGANDEMLEELLKKNKHWKSVLIWSYSGAYYLAFELNTERYSVSLLI